jgi:hypothetical protein
MNCMNVVNMTENLSDLLILPLSADFVVICCKWIRQTTTMNISMPNSPSAM